MEDSYNTFSHKTDWFVAASIVKYMFFNENIWSEIEISYTFLIVLLIKSIY